VRTQDITKGLELTMPNWARELGLNVCADYAYDNEWSIGQTVISYDSEIDALWVHHERWSDDDELDCASHEPIKILNVAGLHALALSNVWLMWAEENKQEVEDLLCEE
jgi:hypothetical protein